MARDNERKVTAGTRFQMSASTFNEMIDMLRWFKRFQTKGGTSGNPSSLIQSSNQVLIVNESGTSYSDMYRILRISGSPISHVTPAAGSSPEEITSYDFSKRPVFNGYTPTDETNAVAVLQSPAYFGDTVPAVLSGHTMAYVWITDSTHLFANPVPGVSSYLQSAECGQFRILMATETESGLHLCALNLIGYIPCEIETCCSGESGDSGDSGEGTLCQLDVECMRLRMVTDGPPAFTRCIDVTPSGGSQPNITWFGETTWDGELIRAEVVCFPSGVGYSIWRVSDGKAVNGFAPFGNITSGGEYSGGPGQMYIEGIFGPGQVFFALCDEEVCDSGPESGDSGESGESGDSGESGESGDSGESGPSYYCTRVYFAASSEGATDGPYNVECFEGDLTGQSYFNGPPSNTWTTYVAVSGPWPTIACDGMSCFEESGESGEGSFASVYCFEGGVELEQDDPNTWISGTFDTLTSEGGGNWTLNNLGGASWEASGWDGTGCKTFTLASGEGAPTVEICAGPCP